ncbi:hypothetical protein [Microvirga zambiensis]|uniref:hypothetical protein n=1 Tax=Microvirga zambiensis TaxID=1402137 RepID=UPI00191F2DEE|nr:hypothetical protein [Microvirga zambiensis]
MRDLHRSESEALMVSEIVFAKDTFETEIMAFTQARLAKASRLTTKPDYEASDNGDDVEAKVT